MAVLLAETSCPPLSHFTQKYESYTVLVFIVVAAISSPAYPLEFHAVCEAHIPFSRAGDAVGGNLRHSELAVGEVGRLLPADVERQLLRGPHGHIAPLVDLVKDALLCFHARAGGLKILSDGDAEDGNCAVIAHNALADIPLHVGLVGGKVRPHLLHVRLNVRGELKIPAQPRRVGLDLLADPLQIRPELRRRHIAALQLRFQPIHLLAHGVRRLHDETFQLHHRLRLRR